MTMMEIVLLAIGVTAFIISFLIPGGKGGSPALDSERARAEIGRLVAQEMEEIRDQVDETVEEVVSHSMEKTQRSLERISNEKIMAVNEYSETVLGQINKSQQEIMFLYDMLNAKHDNLKNAAAEVEQRVRDAETASREMEAVTREAQAALCEVEAARQAARPALQALPSGEEGGPGGLLEEPFAEGEPPQSQQELEGTESYSNKNDEILELHRQGRSNVSIARQLNLGVGEVKLVIDLFKGRND